MEAAVELDREVGLALAARVIGTTKQELEARHRALVRRAPLVERLMAGEADPGDVRTAVEVKLLRDDLEEWRDCRRFFLDGPGSPLDQYGSSIAVLDERAVRDAVRPYMHLPWNGRLLESACTAFMADRRRRNLRGRA